METNKGTQSLTWQDIRRIVEIADMLLSPRRIGQFKEPPFRNEEAYYTEVLKQFNKDGNTNL